MAGRARTEALREVLDRLTREYFDVDLVDVAIGNQAVPTALDYVCAQIEDGVTVKSLCRLLTQPLGYEITFARLQRHLNDTYGVETAQRAQSEARSRASHCLAEEGLDLVDAPAYDAVEVSRARNRATQRNWLAGKWNADVYGAARQTVAISITHIHLDALRSVQPEVTGAPALTALPAGDPIQVVQSEPK